MKKNLLRFVKFSVGIALIPFVIGLIKASLELLSVFKSPNVFQIYFLFGIGFYILIQIIFSKPIKTYIVGHELTHALWAKVFGGDVKNINIKSDSGSVTLSKTNFLITLSPYFFPLYTVFVIILFYLLKIFIDIEPHRKWLFFLIGFTITFHLVFTFYSIQTLQPDIKKTGWFFSIVLIVILNICVVALVVKFSSPDRILLGNFFKTSFTIGKNIWLYLYQTIHQKFFLKPV